MRVRKKTMDVEARGPLNKSETIQTAHGPVIAWKGDYVLTDPKTKDTWPINQAIFMDTYDILPDHIEYGVKPPLEEPVTME